jgi:hypothetical protein
MRDKKTWIRAAILISILLFAIVRSWYGTQLDSLANDEPYHIVSGAYYAQTGDFRLNPEHPPLSKIWVGLWNSDNLKLRPFEPLKDKYEERKWLQEIIFYDNDDLLSQQRSRWAMYSFHFMLGLLIALLVWHIFGFPWAVVSSLWMALEPSLAAHQPLVLTDLPLSYCLLITALTAGLYCRDWKWKWLIAFGISMGMTLAVKHSALPGLAAIIALSAILSLRPVLQKKFRLAAGRIGKLAVVGFLALSTLWAVYGFQNNSSDDNQDAFNRTLTQKIDDLNSPSWKRMIGLMEQTKIVPRAYIWGLADTIRAGIEGRGDDQHLFFGEVVLGRPPILYFPAVIITKIPLALLLMALISLGVLGGELAKRFKKLNSQLNTLQWIVVSFVVVFVVAHILALASGRTSYGGIRHAMPVLGGLGILAGGITLLSFKKIKSLSWIIPSFLFVVTAIMTFGEKRIYEYHNEIVGGTENAYQYFMNEGHYQGQRYYETKAFFDQPEIDETEDIHLWAWYMDEEWKSDKMNIIEGVKDIHDENIEGIMKGYFIIKVSDLVAWPNWDPKVLDSLERVKRIGNIWIMHGEIKDPVSWAYSMTYTVRQYIRETENPDWELVVKRLQQTIEIRGWNTTPYVVLGNALLKLDRKEEALIAYKKGMDNLEEGDPYQKSMLEHIDLVKKSEDVKTLERLRPMDVE